MSYHLEAVTSAISLLFLALILLRLRKGHAPYLVAWAVALSSFAFTSGAEAWGGAAGWSDGLYRGYYVMAASQVGIMGLGAVFLLRLKTGARAFMLYIIAVMALFSVSASLAAVDAVKLAAAGATVGGTAMSNPTRYFSPLMTIPGAIAIMGAAGYSWYRTRHHPNLLLVAGVAVFSGAGSLARLGSPDYLAAGNLAGLVLMFLGSLLSKPVGDGGRRRAAKDEEE